MKNMDVTGLRPLEAPQDETAAGAVVPEAGAVKSTDVALGYDRTGESRAHQHCRKTDAAYRSFSSLDQN